MGRRDPSEKPYNNSKTAQGPRTITDKKRANAPYQNSHAATVPLLIFLQMRFLFENFSQPKSKGDLIYQVTFQTIMGGS